MKALLTERLKKYILDKKDVKYIYNLDDALVFSPLVNLKQITFEVTDACNLKCCLLRLWKILIYIVALMCMCNSLYSKTSYERSELDSLLCQVYEKDQSIRKESYKMFQAEMQERMKFQQRMDSIDSCNQEIVFSILDSIGWPKGLSEMANRGIFIVIDHAKLESQKKYLPLIKEQSDKGIIEKGDYATLLDRVLMKSNQKQIYGTQTVAKNKDGEVKLYVWPIQDSEKVDSLRNNVGLPPLEEYIKLVSSAYKQPCCWDKNLEIEDFIQNP